MTAPAPFSTLAASCNRAKSRGESAPSRPRKPEGCKFKSCPRYEERAGFGAGPRVSFLLIRMKGGSTHFDSTHFVVGDTENDSVIAKLTAPH